MERIHDTRSHYYKNCANSDCPNQIGPIDWWHFNSPELCKDCDKED